MSRKNLYIALAVLLIILGGFGWYFFTRTSSAPSPDTIGGGSDLFPFGSTTPTGSQQGGTVRPGGSGETTIDLSGGASVTKPRLRKVSDDQVSGATLFPKNSVTLIHYMDRATGHIFETDADTMARTKISNITMPQIYETLWSNDGRELIARYLKDDGVTIQSFYGLLPATTTINSSVEGYFLPANMRDLSLSDKKILYLDPTQDGVLVSAQIDGTKKAFVANLYSRDWLLDLANTKIALVGAKPSGLVVGDLYTLDTSTGEKTKIMTDILGLTGIMRPDGGAVFASAAQGSGIASAVYSIANQKLITLSLATLSDKCVWSASDKEIVYCAVPTSVPSGTYPDDWYQGIVSFEDRLWKINVINEETDLLLDPSTEVGIDMDMTHLVVDTTDSHILFTNKKDSSLWVFDLNR